MDVRKRGDEQRQRMGSKDELKERKRVGERSSVTGRTVHQQIPDVTLFDRRF